MGHCVIGSMRLPVRRTPLPSEMRASDALVNLEIFDHNFHRAHGALRLPLADAVRRYHHRSPAMALGLTDHLWSFQDLLTSRLPVTP